MYQAREPIRLKDMAGNLVDYTDTGLTLRLRRALEPINACLNGLHIEIPGAVCQGRHVCIGDALILPTPGNELYRIFNRESFACHGRGYGWWQNIPRSVRPDLMIDGEPTAEADYAALHATMLYCRRGLKLNDDPYEIADFPRDHVKQGFNIALNARDRRSALYALADRAKISAIGPETRVEAAAGRACHSVNRESDQPNEQRQGQKYSGDNKSIFRLHRPFRIGDRHDVCGKRDVRHRDDAENPINGGPNQAFNGQMINLVKRERYHHNSKA